MKLYELTEVYNNLLDLELEDVGPHLEILEDEIGIKLENLAKVIKTLEGENLAYKAEEERIYAKRKSNENKIKNLKAYMKQNMDALEIKKIKTDLFSFGIQKNRASVRILDESKLPEDYFQITRSPMKADIEKALKEGLLTDAAELIQTESLRIR